MPRWTGAGLEQQERRREVLCVLRGDTYVFLWFVCPVGAGVRVWAAPRRSQAVDAESTGPMDMAVSYGMMVGGVDGARRGQHNALGIAFTTVHCSARKKTTNGFRGLSGVWRDLGSSGRTREG